jgi:hypothetical protein
VKHSRFDSGFFFERTIFLDDQIVDTLRQELELRGVTADSDVAIISEQDTYYARALCLTFNPTRSRNVHSYTYLRGIDGKLPSEDKDEKESKDATNTASNKTQSSLRPTERTEGLNQADDIRRLADLLKKLNVDLRKDHAGGLKAVGLLGSDVYDKLELLKALRPILPEAVFFTNHLDACFAHPDEWKETHNLVIVSENDLQLGDPYEGQISPKDLDQGGVPLEDPYQGVAPFRDCGQTALFQATLEAMGMPGIEKTKPQSPLIFEIGRDGPVKLCARQHENLTIKGLLHSLKPSLGFVIPIGGVIIFGGALKMCLVPRVISSKITHGDVLAASSWLAAPICAALAVGAVCCFYVFQNYSGRGERFAWLDGASAWPSIAIMLFAALMSIHFIYKSNFKLAKNAEQLKEEFRLKPDETKKVRDIKDGIDIVALWQQYGRYGQFRSRALRAALMTLLYVPALWTLVSLIGDFPHPPIRGQFPFLLLILSALLPFLFLTFIVIDAILLHEGFLTHLEEKETCWPPETFEGFNYSRNPEWRENPGDLADYWDILLIAKRTETIGNLIYYPFIILFLLIVARLSYFANWTWSTALIVALSAHFSLALYAAWRLPKVANKYREKVVERMERRKRQVLMDSKRQPEAVDTLIAEVRSTHQGAFSYVWEQPAIRALLLPSSGIGIALLQYLTR